jgi:hypothetical protein
MPGRVTDVPAGLALAEDRISGDDGALDLPPEASGRALYRHGHTGLRADLEDAPVALDLGRGAHGLHGVVGELHGRAAVH